MKNSNYLSKLACIILLWTFATILPAQTVLNPITKTSHLSHHKQKKRQIYGPIYSLLEKNRNGDISKNASIIDESRLIGFAYFENNSGNILLSDSIRLFWSEERKFDGLDIILTENNFYYPAHLSLDFDENYFIFPYDSLYLFYELDDTLPLELFQRSFTELDSSGRVTAEISKEFDNLTWENLSKTSYTYNNQSQLTQVVNQLWQQNHWQNFSKYESIYDNIGLPLEETSYL